MLDGKRRVDVLYTSELLCPKLNVMLQLNRTRPNFYNILENFNFCLGISECWLGTRRIASRMNITKKKRIYILAHTPVDYSYSEKLAKKFIVGAKRNQFLKEKITAKILVEQLLTWTHFCIHNIFHEKTILVSAIQSQKN